VLHSPDENLKSINFTAYINKIKLLIVKILSLSDSLSPREWKKIFLYEKKRNQQKERKKKYVRGWKT
jgi:hypothetical protein